MKPKIIVKPSNNTLKETNIKPPLRLLKEWTLTSKSLKNRCVSAKLKIISSIRSPRDTEVGGSLKKKLSEYTINTMPNTHTRIEAGGNAFQERLFDVLNATSTSSV